MRQPLVAGNWKMNGSLDSVTALVEGIKAGLDSVSTAEMAVCPPYVYIPTVATLIGGASISLGAQDVSDQESGAYTGEVAPAMLTDVGCKYAIVGHSERRSIYGESDGFTASKFAAARKAGLVPILCVGELLEEREQGITEQVVSRQLDAVIELEGVGALADAVMNRCGRLVPARPPARTRPRKYTRSSVANWLRWTRLSRTRCGYSMVAV